MECLACVVFDNMELGEAPPLSRLETYSQIIGCLVGKAYKGLHMCCPACTSTSFGTEVTRARQEGPDPKKLAKYQRYSYRDMQLDFWLLLRPLMDRGKESTCQLARRLLSVWHWSSAADPPHISSCAHLNEHQILAVRE